MKKKTQNPVGMGISWIQSTGTELDPAKAGQLIQFFRDL